MADTLIGFVGKDFVMMAADAKAEFSIIMMKHDEDKIMALDSHKLLAASGEAGDRVQFCEFVQKNVTLYHFRNGYSLNTPAAAHFLRGELAHFLRSSPYMVNMLLAGYDGVVAKQQPQKDDSTAAAAPAAAAASSSSSSSSSAAPVETATIEEATPVNPVSLYYIDYLASMQQLPYAAMGYGSYFVYSIMDKYHKPNLSFEDAKILMQMCIDEVKKRLVLNTPKFIVKVVDKDGTRLVDLDTPPAPAEAPQEKMVD